MLVPLLVMKLTPFRELPKAFVEVVKNLFPNGTREQDIICQVDNGCQLLS